MPAFTEALRPALKSERLLTTAVEDHGQGHGPLDPLPGECWPGCRPRPHPPSGGCHWLRSPGLLAVLRAAGRRDAGATCGQWKGSGEG